MALFICAGCGREITDRDSFPQGKERYCRMCNKRYHLWEQWLAQLYAAFDREKADMKAKKRKEIFGTPGESAQREQEYMTRTPIITEEQRTKLDRSLLSPDNTPRDMSEFSPELQKEAEAIQKKKGK